MNKKETLRKKMKKMLKSQKRSERRKKSRIIEKKLFAQNEFLASNCVMLYVSRGTDEVETVPIIRKALCMGKKVFLPVTLTKEKRIIPVCFKSFKQTVLKKGSYGVYEPIRSKSERPIRIKDIDLVVAPGLAFDRKNNRLGRGCGYYDRFLKKLPKDTPKIGLGFRFQLFKNIPITGRDVSLS